MVCEERKNKGWHLFTALVEKVPVKSPLSPRLLVRFGALFSLAHVACAIPHAIAATTAGQLIISEFRLHGPNGTEDEFIEIYNPTMADVMAQASDASGGLGLAASDGVLRATIPNGTVIKTHGHFLIANSGSGARYSLTNYPSTVGNPTTPDAVYTNGITNNVGIALFNSATSFTLATRLDAVGPTTESNATYRKGSGYTAVETAAVDYSFRRKTNLITGLVVDTDDNANDFAVEAVDSITNISTASLGAPGPENSVSPVTGNGGITVSLVAPCVSVESAPNRIRTGSADSGTLSIQRKITNNTGMPITRLRFRIIDITTSPASDASVAILTATNSDTTTQFQPCPSGTVTVHGLTLETPPAQSLGGGYNSSLSATTVTIGTPLAAGASINVNFFLNISHGGPMRFCVQAEALPFGSTALICDRLEYGDAPDSYGTTLANNGARHYGTVDAGPTHPHLGNAVDRELDGQPNATATGDNVNSAGNTNDENGVTFGEFETGATAPITVNASAAAKLDAFIDFNNDGDFADPGEKIFDNQSIAAGNNALQVAVPANAVTGTTFARFRISSAGGLSFNGPAVDGEVEDYQITIVPIQSGPVLTVTTSQDHDDGHCGFVDCTLREAINAANSLAGDNTINFAPNVVGTVTLGSALPDVTTNINLTGPGARVLAISGNNLYRVLSFTSTSSSSVSGLTIRNGRVAGDSDITTAEGGGIHNLGALNVTQCTLINNMAIGANATLNRSAGGGFGGGLYNAGSMTVLSCTFSGNSATAGQGRDVGAHTSATGGGTAAGGLFNLAGGTVNLTDCTFAGNSATGGNGGDGGGDRGGGAGGGGYAAILNRGTLVTTACTIASNTGTGGAGGPGLVNGAAGIAAAVRNDSGASATSGNNIAAANTGSGLVGQGPNVSGAYISNGYNLIGPLGSATGFTATGDQTGVANPLLGSLQNNGGPTDTIALTITSPAVDKGKSFGLTTDQRGDLRMIDSPQFANASGGDGTDIGAFEFHPLVYDAGSDTDMDGMSNDFEVFYGFNPNVAGDAALDSDGDGLTNLQEFQAGTDPRSPTSNLRVTAAAKNGSNFDVTFKLAVVGKKYRLERKDAMTDLMWSSINGVSDLAPAASGTGQFTDLNGAIMPRHFYRVRVLPPP